jgi:hypothetical protein
MVPKFVISPEIEEKLRAKHNVEVSEVYECFLNRHGPFFLETRPEHVTDPATYWFVADTDKQRTLFIAFVHYPTYFAIKSAFDPENGQAEKYEELRREHLRKSIK